MPKESTKEIFTLKDLFNEHPYFVGLNSMLTVIMGSLWFWKPFAESIVQSETQFYDSYLVSTALFVFVSLAVTWWFFYTWNIMVVKITKAPAISFWMAYFISICILGLNNL